MQAFARDDEKKKKLIMYTSLGVLALCVLWLATYFLVLTRPKQYSVDSGYAAFVDQAKKFLNSGPYSGVEIQQIEGENKVKVFGPVLTRADEDAVKKALSEIQPRPELVFELVPDKK